MSDLYRITLSFKADLTFEQVGFVVSALDDMALSSSWKETGAGAWDCLWTLEENPGSEDIKARLAVATALHELNPIDTTSLVIEALPDINWLAESYAGFQPFSLGPFFIYGNHHRGTIEIPSSALPLEIDAATAFGSGEHGTTGGCLLALQKLKERGFTPAQILDMGTGSGILAIAGAKYWPDAFIHAVDNDPECIVVTRRHADVNNIIPEKITAYVSEGFADPRAHGNGPYDLVIANILAAPLIDMAADLARATAKNGYLVLSGLLEIQKEDVSAAYLKQGMQLIHIDTRDEWAILTLAHHSV